MRKPTRPRPRGGLRTDEVDRHAVRLVVIDDASPRLAPFASLPTLLRAGDLLVVNDAATLPASLRGHTSRGVPFELRLSGPVDPHHLVGVLLGEGDFRTRTEDRGLPPVLVRDERVDVAGFPAIVTAVAGRRVELATRLPDEEVYQRIYAVGAPIQYAHRPDALPLFAVQTAYASRPWAAEMPSAGRPLTWDTLLALRRANIELATLTHAAGLSATGDEALDQALPWPERYELPRATVTAIGRTRARGGRVVAVGTTVVRALEAERELRAGSGIASQRITPTTPLHHVDALISGLHVPGESHFELLQAFAPRGVLERGLALASEHGLSSHELGDACLVQAQRR